MYARINYLEDDKIDICVSDIEWETVSREDALELALEILKICILKK